MSTWDILQIFLILAIMMGIMYGLLYLVKKYFYSFDKSSSNDAKVSVLSTQTVLPKKYLSVVKFNNHIYLLGIADQSINLIDKLENDSISEEDQQENDANKSKFLRLLKSNMGLK